MPESEERCVTPEQVLEVLKTCYDPCCKERSVKKILGGNLARLMGINVEQKMAQLKK